jgi:hypothetical protein
MPTYITLLRYTQQGTEKIKESPTRLEAAKQSVRAMGGELKAFYLVMGQYDGVVISELPDDPTPRGSHSQPRRGGTCARRRCGPTRRRNTDRSSPRCPRGKARGNADGEGVNCRVYADSSLA